MCVCGVFCVRHGRRRHRSKISLVVWGATDVCVRADDSRAVITFIGLCLKVFYVSLEYDVMRTLSSYLLIVVVVIT
jgi:hypothetical protein